MNFRVLTSETVYRARAFEVRRNQILYPDGRQATFDIVAHNGAVAMVPVADNGDIIFVRQYRPTADKLLLGLAGGTLNKGEDPQACAQRELREEIGMAPGRLTKLGEFFLAPGYSTERMHVYLAQDLRPERLPHDDDEVLEVVSLSMQAAFAAIRSGEIEEAKTML